MEFHGATFGQAASAGTVTLAGKPVAVEFEGGISVTLVVAWPALKALSRPFVFLVDPASMK